MIDYPKISIITCVLNGEKYISKLLDSVLNMGYPNIEHIIVNDGSTDSTEDIVLKYAELYKNKENSNLYIKYIKQENMGLGGATNTGLKEITGEYWTWINCDDWYEEKAFNHTILKFKKNIDIVIMNNFICYYNQDKIFVKKNRFFNKKIERQYYNEKTIRKNISNSTILQLHYIVKSASFFRLNPTRTIDPYRFNQDLQLSYTLFFNLTIRFAKNAHTFYYLRPDSFYCLNAPSNRLESFKDPFFISALKSFRFLSIPRIEKISQIDLLLLKLHNEPLFSLYNEHKTNDFLLYYNKYYLPLEKNIVFKYKKYLNKKIMIRYYSCRYPLISFLLRMYSSVKRYFLTTFRLK